VGLHISRRGHERAGEHAKARAAELGGEERNAREVERTRRLGVPQLARYDEVAGAQLGRKASRHADEGDGGLLVEIRGERSAGTPGAVRPGTDDDVGATDGEGLNPKRRENLEISRESLRSGNARGP
jgi:hypothetical protein